MDRLADFRQVFAQVVVSRADCRDPSIREAFTRVPRHAFVGPGPWTFSEHGGPTPSDDPALLYQDFAMGLVPERGIPTGQPSLHARCIDACALEPSERVIHIGAGSGYYTAILAELVGETGCVVAFEIDQELAEQARVNLGPWPWAQVVPTSGSASDLGSADLVYVCAAVQRLPRAWLEALRPGGRLVFPLAPLGEEGGMLLVKHVGSPRIFAAEFICRARFVPCEGAADAEANERLKSAFLSGTHGAVRSLRLDLDPGAPDESAWFTGRGFWLSTTPA